MTGDLNRRDATKTTRIHQHHPIVEIFTRHQPLGFFKLLRGHDDDIAREFAMSLIPLARVSAIVVLRGFSVTVTPESIRRITTLPVGLQCRKKDKDSSTLSRKKNFLEGENQLRKKMGLEGGAFHDLGMK